MSTPLTLIRRQFESWAESPASEIQARSLYRQAVFVAILLTIWISTRPFFVLPESGFVGSDPLNQAVFLGLSVLAMLGLFMADHRALKPMLQPSYAALLIVLVVSVVTSTQFDISSRAFAFTLIVMFLGMSLFALPERFTQFQTLFLACALAVMALSYFGVIVWPDAGKHTDFDPFEPEHAGSWKGHFDHKNIAGAAMGCYAIMGVYALRVGRRRTGLFLLMAGVVFLYNTNSKTSFALLPLAIFLGFAAERLPSLLARLTVCVGPILSLVGLTIGAVLIPPIRAMNLALLKDPSFTGRYDIWRFGFEKLAERPWLGYGFEGFWQTSTTLRGESRLELAWAAEKIIHGHNSYLDVMLSLGAPGLLLVVYIFVIKPVIDYHACQPTRENRLLATMFLMMMIFISLGMCLESYYFRRSDPVWFMLLIAVFGLRFTAAYRIDQSPSQAAPASSKGA